VRRIAVLNQKGGSAKTTTAVNLAACLARRGASVLLIDADPQASATAWLGPCDPPYLEHVLEDELPLPDAVRRSRVDGLSLVPASPRLAQAARRLAGQPGASHLLAAAVRRAGPLPCDVLLVDCAPELGLLALNALLAVNEILIPVVMDGMALRGLAQVLDTLALLETRLGHQVRVAGVLATRVRGRTRLSRAVLDDLARRHPGLLLPVSIREAIAAAEAPAHRLPLIDYAPACAAALDYQQLADLLHPPPASAHAA
jgi:chromosome partitioning protein